MNDAARRGFPQARRIDDQELPPSDGRRSVVVVRIVIIIVVVVAVIVVRCGDLARRGIDRDLDELLADEEVDDDQELRVARELDLGGVRLALARRLGGGDRGRQRRLARGELLLESRFLRNTEAPVLIMTIRNMGLAAS